MADSHEAGANVIHHIGTIAQAGWIALATLASGTAFALEPDNMVIPLTVVVTIVIATWRVSRRVAKFEDRLAAVEKDNASRKKADERENAKLDEILRKLNNLNHG